MATPRKYSHDRSVLLLLTLIGFIGIGSILLLAVRLLNSHATSYIIENRTSLGLSAFQPGDKADLIIFFLCIPSFMVIGYLLSRQTYPLRRHMALVILSLTVLLVLTACIVSNALLNLR